MPAHLTNSDAYVLLPAPVSQPMLELQLYLEPMGHEFACHTLSMHMQSIYLKIFYIYVEIFVCKCSCGLCTARRTTAARPACTPRWWRRGGEQRLLFFARSDLQPGQELTYNYRFKEEQARCCSASLTSCRV